MQKLPDNFDAQAIDAWLSSQVKQPNRVGLSVAIIKDGEVVLARGYGKRSLEDGRPVEKDTIFAVGSVTKQFTCACVLLLAEDGKLSVHDPVAKYFPELTRAQDISLLDLMNHVSGYTDYYPLDFVDRRMQQPILPDELLRQYAGGKLDFDPGAGWSYSNTGYVLLGRVVEKVSGEGLGEFLKRRIFRPLQMDHSVYQPDLTDQRLAHGYTTFALSPPELARPEASGWLGGAGGMYSTPTDLARWELALMNGKLLKPESFELMTSCRKLADGRLSDYGCGLRVRTRDGRVVLSHDGAVSGFNASTSMIPSTRSAVIMMCNIEAGLGSLPEKVLGLLLKQPLPSVNGLPDVEAVKAVFARLQSGKIDRREFSEEFNHYLTDKKVSGAAARLRPLGKPAKAEVIRTYERGGMEVSVTRLSLKTQTLSVLMYRKPSGIIEQFFVYRD